MNLTAETPRFAFIMEQTLGHVTHYQNMRSAIDAEALVNATWIPLAFPVHGTLETLPGLRDNWSVRASLRARRVLARRHAASTFQALFFHTQVTALLSTSLMRRVPSVVSLDATPINYDCVGSGYGHQVSGRLAEGLKLVINRRPLLAARALITWCEWARRSLINDYGVSAERITVIPPGVPLSQWPAPRVRPDTGPLNIL
ncbi:MAG TPA: glycosyltransferase, partial [Chloroflexota bacterium]|nr:glycosyltransferase [Chloroflexota bacterium]